MKLLNNLDLVKNQIQNVVLHLLGTDPAGQAGQVYYNTTDNRPKVHNGTSWFYLLTSNLLGVNNGLASLDGNGKIPTTQLPDSILGQLEYQGVWDASGGSAPGSPAKGFYWVISVGGTISAVPYGVGDWIVYNGVTFDKVDNTDAVMSVAGRTGAVVLTTADVAASGDRQYVTAAQQTVITNTSGTNSGNETATSIGTIIVGSAAKATPVDADNFGYSDSAASNVLKKFTFANMKAALKTYFDTLYNNYSHPNHTGEVTSTGDGATVIATNAVTNAKLAQVATATIKGRVTAATGNVEDLTAAQVRTLINVADGANNYVHPSTDGSLHVPANGTGNNGKFLQATGVAGSYQWANVPAGISKFSVTIGNGTLTSLPVTHNLNTRAVTVTLFETASPYAEVLTDVEHTDLNNVTFKFAVAPTAGQYTAVVIG